MWDPSLPGLGEARFTGLQSTLIANLANLNTALHNRSYLPAGVSITAAMVRIGDVEEMPSRDEAPVLICLEDSPVSTQITQIETGGDGHPTTGLKHAFETEIFIYLQPEAIASDDTAADFGRVRTLMLQCLVDWATTGTLNTVAGRRIALASRIYSPSTPDILQGQVEEVEIDFYGKSYGNNLRLRGARLLHRSFVA